MEDTENRKAFMDVEGEIREESERTVEMLLEQLKTDEFEKIYVATIVQSNSPTNEQISDEQMQNVKTLAEYQLSQKASDTIVTEQEKIKLDKASNFYLIPHAAKHNYTIGNELQTETMYFYTINDVEGYALYSVIEDRVSISTGFRERIKQYLEENYPSEMESGVLRLEDAVEYFTPRTLEEVYDFLSGDRVITMRFLPDRMEEFVQSRGVKTKALKMAELEQKDDLAEENKVTLKEDTAEEEQELEETDGVRQETEQEQEEEEQEPEPEEDYIERIARVNHVKPAVVNTRIIENFEKVEEDTGIPLKGRYPRGEVVAVRIPYKLGYRTFLVEKSTGLAIDGQGRRDSRPDRLYDFDEIEDYFRFQLRPGPDGGNDGKPLREDEGRDYITYIDEKGDINEQKYVNNGKKQDMLREERERYLTEVEEVDQKLKEAIEEYQKHATHENYQKVRDLIKEKVNIDNKYNALDEQRDVTKQTIENTENVIQKDLDDDDDEWFPGPGGRFHH